MARTSLPQIDDALIRITAWPIPGTGSGTSTSSTRDPPGNSTPRTIASPSSALDGFARAWSEDTGQDLGTGSGRHPVLVRRGSRWSPARSRSTDGAGDLQEPSVAIGVRLVDVRSEPRDRPGGGGAGRCHRRLDRGPTAGRHAGDDGRPTRGGRLDIKRREVVTQHISEQLSVAGIRATATDEHQR